MKIFSLLIVSISAAVLLITGTFQYDLEQSIAEIELGTVETSNFLVDKAHSKIGFRVRHLGIANVNGAFDDYEAKVTFDSDDLSTLRAEATIKSASINTGIERRDNHLRSDDFFNVETHPEISFVSKAVRNVEGSEFELVGDLTIRDITKEVVLDAAFIGLGQMGDTKKAGFEASVTINRFDYNLKWDRLTEAGGLVVAENVKIQLDLELNEDNGE